MTRSLASLGFKVGVHRAGRLNHLLDVPGGLGVAHRSYRDASRGVCTGFTVIQPAAQPGRRRAAAVVALNGAGELVGSHTIHEWGLLETPIVLTNTPSVGRAYDGVSDWMMARKPEIGARESVVIPVVGECDDSVLHEPRVKAWSADDLLAALDESLEIARAADRGVAPPASALVQGDLGAGTGMTNYDLKSGIGSASRVVTAGDRVYTVGVLLQTNFGTREQLTVLGRNVGPRLALPMPKMHREGSCIGVLATDAPLSPLGLQRLARRMGLGLARTGCHAHHGSGEIFLAFSTAETSVHELEWQTPDWNPLLQAAVEASEESVYNALLAAGSVENVRASVAALTLESLKAAGLAAEVNKGREDQDRGEVQDVLV